MPFIAMGALLVALIVIAVVLQKRAGQARARIDAGLASLDVLRQDKANLYGQASKGEGQVRTLGALALTPDELVFFHYVPEGQTRVPRPAITGVEVGREFLDKSYDVDLLVVSWTDPATGDDSVAFDVADHGAWRADMAPAG